MRQKLHWSYYMTGALFLIIGVLSFTACVMLSIKGTGNTISIDKEYDKEIIIGVNENDQSGEDRGTGNTDNADDDTGQSGHEDKADESSGNA